MDVVLIEPQNPGNIGAIARVMKNFGFEKLVLVNPKCDHLCKEARNRAVHAQEVLKKAKVKKDFSDYDYKIGTTSVLGSDYNIPRSPVAPMELAAKLSKVKGKFALIFGREDHGLSNEEIGKCDFIVTIPTNKKYPALNLSHSVAVLLYELSKNSKVEKIGESIKPVGSKEKEKLIEIIDDVLDNTEFRTEHKKETQKKVWRKIIGKAMLTNREAISLMGFFRKIK